MSEETTSPERTLLEGGGVMPELDADLLAKVMASAHDFLLHTDENGLIRFINQIFSDHESSAKVLGVHCIEFVTEASKPLLETALQVSRTENTVQDVEIEMLLGAWLQTRVIPIVKDGHFEGHVLISADVTALKQTQLELERANALLATRVGERDASLVEESARREVIETRLVESQRLESLGALASGIAHEYNNLLTVILGNAGLAQMLLPENSPAREAIKHLETATVHAAELTNQLLTFSGHARVKTERLNLSQAITELATLMEAILKGGKSLELSCEPELPPVLGDLGQMQQVLMHLIQQASDNLGVEAGAIRIETGAASLSAKEIAACYLNQGVDEGEYVFLRVCDSGTPLTKAQCSHFFEPFSLHSPRDQGLGPAAVLGIVRSYGGTAQVRSHDKGNQVTLYFPVYKGADVHGEGQGRNLLLVDDDVAVRGTMDSLLNQLGYKVCCLDSGQAAIDYLQELTAGISVVFLDANMPGMRGVECFDAIRELQPNLPIVVMSGYAEETIRKEFAGRDFQGILQKPFRFPELERIVRETVGAP
jgi:signal transduction histidine kinase/CheY-like chemotaxis protein